MVQLCIESFKTALSTGHWIPIYFSSLLDIGYYCCHTEKLTSIVSTLSAEYGDVGAIIILAQTNKEDHAKFKKKQASFCQNSKVTLNRGDF